MTAELTKLWSKGHYVPKPGLHYSLVETFDLHLHDEIIALTVDGIKPTGRSVNGLQNFPAYSVFAWLKEGDGLVFHKIK